MNECACATWYGYIQTYFHRGGGGNTRIIPLLSKPSSTLDDCPAKRSSNFWPKKANFWDIFRLRRKFSSRKCRFFSPKYVISWDWIKKGLQSPPLTESSIPPQIYNMKMYDYIYILNCFASNQHCKLPHKLLANSKSHFDLMQPSLNIVALHFFPYAALIMYG